MTEMGLFRMEDVYVVSEKELADYINELQNENEELFEILKTINERIDEYLQIADENRIPLYQIVHGDDLGYWNGVYQYMKKLKQL